MKVTKSLAVMAAVAPLALPFAAAGTASAQTTDGQSYQATLDPLNNSGASGTLMLTLNGDQATITEHTAGLAATFNGNPYPHVQHIHGLGQGQCPTMSADTNGDGIVDTVEGRPAYGKIQTTLSTSGDTGAAAGTDIKIAPSGASYDYSRTITLSQDSLKAVTDGNAVIVVHGLDPSGLSQQAQGEKSKLVPSLPIAATSPALCGKLVAAQTSSVPSGGAQTGGGGTASVEDVGLFALGGGLLAAAGGALGLRRRRQTS